MQSPTLNDVVTDLAICLGSAVLETSNQFSVNRSLSLAVAH